MNIWNLLSVSLPMVNTGSAVAGNVLVREVMLDSDRPSKLAVPWSLGDIAPGSISGLNPGRDVALLATFSLDGLAVGEKHVATVKGTYERSFVTYSFTLAAAVTVPAPQVLPKSALPATSMPLPDGFPQGDFEFLAARVQAVAEENKEFWTYTLYNDEKAGSDRYVNSFQITMAAPFMVKETPAGWTVQTDNHSFVLWHAAGSSIPNSHDLAPGGSLSGFQIQSASTSSEGMVYSIHSWNHKTNSVDRLSLGTVLTPARQR